VENVYIFHIKGRRIKCSGNWSQTGAKLEPNQSSADNPHNARREASRHFRNKKKEYLKAKID